MQPAEIADQGLCRNPAQRCWRLSERANAVEGVPVLDGDANPYIGESLMRRPREVGALHIGPLRKREICVLRRFVHDLKHVITPLIGNEVSLPIGHRADENLPRPLPSERLMKGVFVKINLDLISVLPLVIDAGAEPAIHGLRIAETATLAGMLAIMSHKISLS